MFSELNTINLFITRKCNIKCDHCRINYELDNYLFKPEYYSRYKRPSILSYETWIDIINKVYRRNADILFNIDGSEPSEYNNLMYILKHLHSIGANYKLNSNCTDYNKLIYLHYNISHRFDTISTFISIDDLYNDTGYSETILDNIIRLKQHGYVHTIICKLFVTNDLSNLNNIINKLDFHDIKYEICTYLNTATPNYDYKFIKCVDTDDKIYAKYNYNLFQSSEQCSLNNQNKLQSLSVDIDGTIRLCNNIRGYHSNDFKIIDILSNDFTDFDQNLILSAIKSDKERMCKGCSELPLP